ncbi:MAG: glycosyl transferase [Eubacteriales bacterium]
MNITSERARSRGVTAESVLRAQFSSVLVSGAVSAQFVSATGNNLCAGVYGLPFSTPVISALLQADSLYAFFEAYFRAGRSVLISYINGETAAFTAESGDAARIVSAAVLSDAESACIKNILDDSMAWGGKLDAEGELTCDLASPAPGPHYYTNLLIGNRIDFDRPLQSTPKSAVDRLGGGSFRSHADTQVLATRWDYLPEENGFPANRQFYLLENGKQIFYSGSAVQEGVSKASCTHAQNRTVISYKLDSGLTVRRTIFILPQEEGLPLAAEAQMIEIANDSDRTADLRIVYTGMFGTSECHALREDVIFSTVVSQSEVFYSEKGEIQALSFNPNPKWTKGNVRYCTLMVHQEGKVIFPDQFCVKYGEFVGSGTLAHPENLARLSNHQSRKGPGFFAMSAPFSVPSHGCISADHFTCLTSDAVNSDFREDETVKTELAALISRYQDPEALPKALKTVSAFARMYASYLQISHKDKDFEAYVNNNLPFQVFYQTFVSRSLDWTQKGYREIGFREIQDVFASMYYFAGMGQIEFVRKLIREWAGNVACDGYANHNFYWTGKEPGWWSDDALWLLQALDRYVSLTGDYEFLREEIPVAGTDTQKRSLLGTIKAIITYSNRVSVGKHGLPLIDRADWNDCLRVDPDCQSGPDKILNYGKQLRAAGKEYGEIPYESEYSESVMNGFLLKVAIDAAIRLFRGCGDEIYANELEASASVLKESLAKNAWKDDYFARVLFNRSDTPMLSYLGASDDGLAIEDGAKGTYFLNSFSWSVLSDCAGEAQIETMLDTIDRNLRTPYGFRLCTGVDYPKIAPKIDVALYFAGDRENGGIFKHANMMAAAAMFKAAKTVGDCALAERLTETAYWVVDCILPYRTLINPFMVCGNPRLCTQYNNSETGENIGPTLSGTSTWLLLCLFMGFGIEFTSESLIIDPILRGNDTGEDITVNTGKAVYHIVVTKPEGFRRTREGVTVVCDGQTVPGVSVPVFTDGMTHEVQVSL